VQRLRYLALKVEWLLATLIQEEFHLDPVVLLKGNTIASVELDFNDVLVENGLISNRLLPVLNAVLE